MTLERSAASADVGACDDRRMHEYISLIVAVIGFAVYALTKDKLAELGRLAFACGLFVQLLVLARIAP